MPFNWSLFAVFLTLSSLLSALSLMPGGFMGAITDDKKIYDQYAVDYFKQRGWKAFPVAKTGRYADVVALRGKDLAIVEVKSPQETSCVKAYDDSANLSDRLEREVGDYLKNIGSLFFQMEEIT